MLFKLNIRRRCSYLWYSTFTQFRRLIIFFGIILLFIILIVLTRRETCWLDKYRSRLFCFVLTNEANLESRARAVYETWGRRCGRFVLVSRLNSSIKYELPIENIPTLPDETYSHLSDKVRASLLFFNEYYPNYDWYLKADDDTYIIVENLLRFLISYRFREDYYVSGGAGYILTRKGLDLFSSYMKNDSIYSQCNSSMEDIMVGQCLKNILQLLPFHIRKDLELVGETVDEHGRERFHPLAFRIHFNGPSNKTKREWIHFRPFHHNLFGYEALSETTISFHYTQPSDMYEMDAFIYDIRLFDKQVCRSHL
ncbi:unnamed protein product [Rotaria sp. Silwood2]|nr:unnamed protein product [Rotaria sp. Silwood2]